LNEVPQLPPVYGGELFSFGGNMLGKFCRINRGRLRVFRLAAIVFGFACLLHLTHRECAKTADQIPKQVTVPFFTGFKPAPSYKPSPSNKPSEVFHATAYSLTGMTTAGVPAAPGYVAADPRVIPLGSVIYVESPLMSGVYQVMDTGELIKGKIIDIFIPSYEACKEFGRRMVKVKVLRYGFQKDQPKKNSDK
jgi:3D (Asp-Asp-Asp) domain-containing protein